MSVLQIAWLAIRVVLFVLLLKTAWMFMSATAKGLWESRDSIKEILRSVFMKDERP